ncbi:MAG: nucleoside recognition protein [Spirochaetota bacterium]
MISSRDHVREVWKIFRGAIRPAVRSALWLLSIMVPISLGAALLRYYGLLGPLASPLAGAFRLLGLPAEGALVFITSVFVNIYSAIGVIGTLSLNLREATILALMCLISHNLIVETSVVRRMGSNGFAMLLIRLGGSLVGAVMLNLLLPESLTSMRPLGGGASVNAESLGVMLFSWGRDSLRLSGTIVAIVIGLTFLSRILEYYNVVGRISRFFRPILAVLGLPEKSAFLWVVANILGLAYGAAVMFENVEEGKLDREKADLLNYHLVLSHSLLEDTLLFVAIGVGAVWITVPRLILAALVVWGRRAVLRFDPLSRKAGGVS